VLYFTRISLNRQASFLRPYTSRTGSRLYVPCAHATNHKMKSKTEGETRVLKDTSGMELALFSVYSLDLTVVCFVRHCTQIRIALCRFEFVPQVIFLGSLFGYLSLLIIIKWVSGSQADLYHVMIYMFLSPGSVEKENQLFWGQAFVQVSTNIRGPLRECLPTAL
jgi:hypothetical protein